MHIEGAAVSPHSLSERLLSPKEPPAREPSDNLKTPHAGVSRFIETLFCSVANMISAPCKSSHGFQP